MINETTESDVLTEAERLDGQGVDELTALENEIEQEAAQHAADHGAKVQRAGQLRGRYAALQAERQQAEQRAADQQARQAAEARYREQAEPTHQHAAELIEDAEAVTESLLQWLEAERTRAALAAELGIPETDQAVIIRQGTALHPVACLAMIMRPDDPRWRGTRLVGPRPRGFS